MFDVSGRHPLPEFGQQRHHACDYGPRTGSPGLSIVIPNRNGVHLLPRCLHFLAGMASAFDLIIVDNRSDDPALPPLYRGLAERYGARVIPFDRSFNYARMINIGVAAARHDMLLLLNNDVFISDASCVATALVYAARPEVGVAGSLLRYPDGRVQHAGMLLRLSPDGVCEVDHVLRFARNREGGYPGALTAPHEWQAVTGAFQVMRKQVFVEAGGYDEVNLPVEHNDVDFCLRVRAMGLRVVTLPLEGIVHDESHTRSGMDSAQARQLRSEARSVMRVRWKQAFAQDPFRTAGPDLKALGDVERPPKVKKTLQQRLVKIGRQLRARFRDAPDLPSITARARLPLGLQPGLSLVGPMAKGGRRGEGAWLLGRACEAALLAVDHVDLAGRQPGRALPAGRSCAPYPYRLASLCIADIDGLRDARPALGEGRFTVAYPCLHDSPFIQPSPSVLELFDEIWLPSRFAWEALRGTTRKPVRLIRQPIAVPPGVTVADGGAEFRVMMVFDRDLSFEVQNPIAAITAFQAAFPAPGDVELIIVMRGSPKPHTDRRIARAVRSDRRIRIIEAGTLHGDGVATSAQVFLSLHRADAVGLRIGQAMAEGRVVVSTAWGAAAEMVTPLTGYPVRHRLQDVPEALSPQGGIQWAEPDIGDAVAALRAAADRPAARLRAAAGRSLIEAEYSLDACGRRIAAALAEAAVDSDRDGAASRREID